jgi:hypothetical protein
MLMSKERKSDEEAKKKRKNTVDGKSDFVDSTDAEFGWHPLFSHFSKNGNQGHLAT